MPFCEVGVSFPVLIEEGEKVCKVCIAVESLDQVGEGHLGGEIMVAAKVNYCFDCECAILEPTPGVEPN